MGDALGQYQKHFGKLGMYLLAAFDCEINVDVSEVFELTSDLVRFGDWFPQVVKIDEANDLSPGQVGKAYLEHVRIPLAGEKVVEIVVTESERNQYFATEGNLSPLLPRMEMRYSTVTGNDCRLQWKMYSRSGSSLVRCALLPLARRIMSARALDAKDNLINLLASGSERRRSSIAVE